MKALVFLCLLPAAFAGYLESVAASVAAGPAEPFQAMVAFKCGRPSIHTTPSGGWVRDMSQDCVANSAEVKSYCQRMYPKMEIVNVEPTPYKVRIANWCNFDEKDCTEGKGSSVLIHPYRCLAAGFQSDALLVPSNCTFHHVVPGMSSEATEQKKECKEYNEWKVTAATECNRMSAGRRKLSSYSGLLDCKKDDSHKFSYFEGVEFVCCPPGQISQPPTHGFVVEEQKKKETIGPKRDPYTDYLNRADDDKETEHDRYVAAKEARKKGMTQDEDRLVRTYIEAERGLESKWEVDPEGTSKEEETIVQRFTAAFSALLDEEMAELRQLDHVHQERVFMKLRAKSVRNKKMLEYVIQETDPKLERISTATFSYLRAVMKEKVHAINHHAHLLDSDPQEAKKQLQNLRTYLQKLHKDIKEILGKIAKSLPTLSSEMKTRVLKFMATYSEVETSSKSLEEKGELPDAPIQGQSRKEVEIEHMQSVIKAYRHKPAKPVVHVEPVPDKEYDLKKEEDMDQPVSLEEKEDIHETSLHRASPSGPHHAKAMLHSRMEGGAHHGSLLPAEGDDNKQVRIVSGNMSMWAIIGSVAGVALIAALTALLVLRRRYAGYTRSPHSDPAVVAIERSLAPSAVDETGDLSAMQTNGYENPTYKYFELKGQEQDGGNPKA